MSDRSFALTPGKRVLYLTKDPDRIRQQLAGTLALTMADVDPSDLLDDINTDAMTPGVGVLRLRSRRDREERLRRADRERRSG